jgi:hypothetical protein
LCIYSNRQQRQRHVWASDVERHDLKQIMMVKMNRFLSCFDHIFFLEPPPPASQWNGGKSDGFSSFRNNNNDENSNPNNGGGFGSRSGGGGSGFSGSYSQFDFDSYRKTFSFQLEEDVVVAVVDHLDQIMMVILVVNTTQLFK